MLLSTAAPPPPPIPHSHYVTPFATYFLVDAAVTVAMQTATCKTARPQPTHCYIPFPLTYTLFTIHSLHLIVLSIQRPRRKFKSHPCWSPLPLYLHRRRAIMSTPPTKLPVDQPPREPVIPPENFSTPVYINSSGETTWYTYPHKYPTIDLTNNLSSNAQIFILFSPNNMQSQVIARLHNFTIFQISYIYVLYISTHNTPLSAKRLLLLIRPIAHHTTSTSSSIVQ